MTIANIAKITRKMRNKLLFTFALLGIVLSAIAKENPKNIFPDGSKIPKWFLDKTKLQLEQLGKQFIITIKEKNTYTFSV